MINSNPELFNVLIEYYKETRYRNKPRTETEKEKRKNQTIRNIEIIKKRQSGLTLKKISEEYGISTTRVRHILSKFRAMSNKYIRNCKAS